MKKDESSEASANMGELVHLQRDMQEMVINQMKQQREFFVNQRKKTTRANGG